MSAKLYCLVGRVTGDLLSWKGRVLVHEDKAELEYLFPANRVVELPSIYAEDLTMPLKFHPDMEAVQFPLAEHMDQFRKR